MSPRKKRGNRMATGEGSVSFEPKNVEELRHFFEAIRDRHHEIWIVLTNKKYADPQPVTFNETINEAVKQGLIDSRSRSLSEQKYAVRFTKRITKE
jgi:hypothetical protein